MTHGADAEAFSDDGNTWVGLTSEDLRVGAVSEWAVLPGCGAVVTFTGTVRDHADGREGVQSLTYEAYEEIALTKMAAVAAEARRRWPVLGRIAVLHRVGRLGLGDAAVVVVVSTPHRPESFDACRFLIDAVKASVPIWKHEVWDGGADWGTAAQPLTEPNGVPSAERPGVRA